MKNLVLILSISILFFSCKDDDSVQNEASENEDCVFVQNDENMDGLIDNNERELMESCLESRINSSSELEENLIGTWELIGHGEGWLTTASQPCAKIIYDANGTAEYSFSNADIDTTLTLDWTVVKNINDPSIVGVEYISTGIPGLPYGVFCEEFIFRDASALDGNMFLYQKVE